MRTVLVAAIALALWAPAAAHGANVSVGAEFLEYEAAPGEANRLSLSFRGDFRTVDVTESGAPLSVGDHCTSTGPNSATCTLSEAEFPDRFLLAASVALGDGDDTLDTVTVPNSISGLGAADGGPGNDVLRGSSGRDGLIGGGGIDELHGGGDVDTLSDGDSEGATDGTGTDGDTFDGGDGVDTVLYSGRALPVLADLRAGSAEGDVFRDVENLTGGDGDDRLAGDDGGNRVRGGDGDDELAGRGNPFGTEADDDRLVGGRGFGTLLGGRGQD